MEQKEDKRRVRASRTNVPIDDHASIIQLLKHTCQQLQGVLEELTFSIFLTTTELQIDYYIEFVSFFFFFFLFFFSFLSFSSLLFFIYLPATELQLSSQLSLETPPLPHPRPTLQLCPHTCHPPLQSNRFCSVLPTPVALSARSF